MSRKGSSSTPTAAPSSIAVDMGDGKMTKFEFNCPSGTVFDESSTRAS